ncbi:MAG: ROK family protein [bacterium]
MNVHASQSAAEKEGRVYLGLETGGTKLVATLADAQGSVLDTRRQPRAATNDAEQTVQALLNLADRLMSEHGIARADLAAVGFGFGGTVDRQHHEPTLSLHESGWARGDFRARIEQHFEVPVFCENDCNMAALAEAHQGAGVTRGVTFYMTVGSGIGGGIVHDGRLLECSRWGEAEIGHLVVDPLGPTCSCGNRGCLEALCSGWGLAGMARQMAPQFMGCSGLADHLPSLAQVEVAKALFAAYPGDPLAEACIARFCDLMAQACAVVMNLLVPKVIVFGGGVMRENWLIEAIAARTRRRVAPYLKEPTHFTLARLGEQAVPVGAILHARQCIRRRSGSMRKTVPPDDAS